MLMCVGVNEGYVRLVGLQEVYMGVWSLLGICAGM